MEGLRSNIKTELNAEICVTKLKLKVKDYPVLQDIDWNISDILIHNPEGSIEEIVFKLTDGVSSDTTKECRTQLFKIALCKLGEEITVKENTDIAIRLRNRRGETSNTKNAKDLVELLTYVSSICAGFPHNAILPGSIIDNTPCSVQGAGAIQPKDVQPGAALREAAQRKAVQQDRVHATNPSQNTMTCERSWRKSLCVADRMIMPYLIFSAL